MEPVGGVRRYLPTIAIAMASLALIVSVVLGFNALNARNNICESRNEDRVIFRAQLTEDLQRSKTFPDEVFKQFNLTKEEALSQTRKRIASFAPLDCG